MKFNGYISSQGTRYIEANDLTAWLKDWAASEAIDDYTSTEVLQKMVEAFQDSLTTMKKVNPAEPTIWDMIR